VAGRESIEGLCVRSSSRDFWEENFHSANRHQIWSAVGTSGTLVLLLTHRSGSYQPPLQNFSHSSMGIIEAVHFVGLIFKCAVDQRTRSHETTGNVFVLTSDEPAHKCYSHPLHDSKSFGWVQKTECQVSTDFDERRPQGSTFPTGKLGTRRDVPTSTAPVVSCQLEEIFSSLISSSTSAFVLLRRKYGLGVGVNRQF
jgi:hypothetical protein